MLERVRDCFRQRGRDRTNERRTVRLCDPQAARQFPSNEVKSAKYNVLTFLPANLWEQFHRPINLYFLLMAALQFVPNVAPVSPYTTIFPITVAFLINTVKEGIDDVRRHRQDRENNSRPYTVLDPDRKTWTEVKSQDVHVGDLLLLRPFETVPSDVVVLMSSGEDGEAYISTESLDGEAGTKERLAVLRGLYNPALLTAAAATTTTTPPTPAVADGENTRQSQAHVRPSFAPHALREAVDFLSAADVVVHSDGPNALLHAWSATVTVTTASGLASSSESPRRRRRSREGLRSVGSSVNSFSSSDEREALLSAEDRQRHARDEKRRGFSAATTRKCLGVSIENAILASSVTRNSRFLLAMVVFTGMETKTAVTRGATPTKWANIDRQFNRMTMMIFVLQFVLLVVYSCRSDLSLRSHVYWYLGGSHRRISPHEYMPILPLRYFTMLSPMVPLSFKVMVEVSKAYISSVIRWDDELRDKADPHRGAGEGASVNNSALAEDLGQVEYVFSDKTGTLTANTMSLAALATADGTVYACSEEVAAALGCGHAAELAELAGRQGAPAPPAAVGLRALLSGMTFCNTIERSILAGVVRPPQSGREARKRYKRRVAAPAPEKTWVSCSPDETALVEGVEVCGVRLLERTRQQSSADFWGSLQRVSIAKVLLFSSERGRMGVLIKPMPGEEGPVSAASSAAVPDGEYTLLMKGSDEKVLPLCVEASYLSPTVPKASQPAAVLRRFSSRGLRTLVYAYRHVSAREAATWLAAVEKAEATLAADQRAARIQEAYATMERGMTYCGCTAVEDQLQEQVGATVSQMRNAGMRVWMLTGDKAETARQTAVASGLLTPQDCLFSLSPAETSPAAAGWSARQHQLDHVRSTVRSLLHDGAVLRDDVPHGKVRSLLQRVYRHSGMRDYVQEFVRPLSFECLKPLNHPFKLQNPDPERYPPAMVNRVTTISRQTTAAPASSPSPTHALGVADGGFTAGYSLLLSGSTVEAVLECPDEALRKDFVRVLLQANTVICSRTAPDQKATMVEMVKAAGKVTLAVGDGGNDVAMIQAAHVGVGIKGKEGSQAALSSDFAIGQFRFLARLLLVHGHIAYQRTAVIVQQSFWKSVLIAWVQLLYNLFTDFSGVSYWDSFSLALYNAIPTVPVTFLCVMDMPLSPLMLVRNPQLYRMSQRGRYLSAVSFYGYVARSLLHGTMVFLLSTGVYRGGGGVRSGSGRTMDRGGDFYAAYFAVVTIHTYTVLTESHSIHFAHWQCFLFSVWSCFLCFGWASVPPTKPGSGGFRTLLSDPHFYLCYVAITAAVCYSQALFATVKAFWFPDMLQLQRTAGLVARSAVTSPHAALLAALFEDDNPSSFWQSWSPLHAFFTFGSPTPTAGAAAATDRAPPHEATFLEPPTV